MRHSNMQQSAGGVHKLKGPPPTIAEVHAPYLTERLERNGSNVSRPRKALENIRAFFGDAADPTDIEIGDWIRYQDHRYEQGVGPATVHRELTFHQASMYHAYKRRRVAMVPHVEKPSNEVTSERRAATEEEFALLMDKGVMTYRIRMLFLMAYHTGHRAQALEQVTWDRVDFENRLIDFNLPGKSHRNKRRNEAFPISDDLLRILLAAKKVHDMRTPKDPYVIGAGERGKASSTGAKCKAAWKSVGINVRGLNRHCLRKTFVTERVKIGVPLPIVSNLIRDRSETTEKHYVKFQQQVMRDAVNRRVQA